MKTLRKILKDYFKKNGYVLDTRKNSLNGCIESCRQVL